MVDNVSPRQAWEALTSDPDAQLIDCRTDAEWQYVGIPDLRRAGKQAVLVSWQYFPSGNVNSAFVDEIRDAGLEPSQKLYFLCRSGVRSMAAAIAAQRRRLLPGLQRQPMASKAPTTPKAIAAPWPAGRPKACRGGSRRKARGSAPGPR